MLEVEKPETSNKPASTPPPSNKTVANSQSSVQGSNHQAEVAKIKSPTANPPPPNNAPLKYSLKPSIDPQATYSSLSKSSNNSSLQASMAVKKDTIAPIKNSKEIPVTNPANKRQASNTAQPFKPPQQLLQSPSVKSKLSHTDGVRSPGMVTPSPSMTAMKKYVYVSYLLTFCRVTNKRKASGSEGLEAEDLFDMMSE